MELVIYTSPLLTEWDAFEIPWDARGTIRAHVDYVFALKRVRIVHIVDGATLKEVSFVTNLVLCGTYSTCPVSRSRCLEGWLWLLGGRAAWFFCPRGRRTWLLLAMARTGLHFGNDGQSKEDGSDKVHD